MKKILEIALGIVTSVGGFLEIGSITTAAQAGADFSFQLILITPSLISIHLPLMQRFHCGMQASASRCFILTGVN